LEWLDRVALACASAGGLAPTTYFCDIGPIGEWGRPTDPSTRHLWPRYHSQIWQTEDAHLFDTFLVDGRFRVACFFQIVLRSKPGSTIMVHDYQKRKSYHVIESFAKKIHVAENLTVFKNEIPVCSESIREHIEKYKFTFD
jgi:hypothetical protein